MEGEMSFAKGVLHHERRETAIATEERDKLRKKYEGLKTRNRRLQRQAADTREHLEALISRVRNRQTPPEAVHDSSTSSSGDEDEISEPILRSVFEFGEFPCLLATLDVALNHSLFRQFLCITLCPSLFLLLFPFLCISVRPSFCFRSVLLWYTYYLLTTAPDDRHKS